VYRDPHGRISSFNHQPLNLNDSSCAAIKEIALCVHFHERAPAAERYENKGDGEGIYHGASD